jgi:hypothetical protein
LQGWILMGIMFWQAAVTRANLCWLLVAGMRG